MARLRGSDGPPAGRLSRGDLPGGEYLRSQDPPTAQPGSHTTRLSDLRSLFPWCTETDVALMRPSGVSSEGAPTGRGSAAQAEAKERTFSGYGCE